MGQTPTVKTVGARAAIVQADRLIAKAELRYPAASIKCPSQEVTPLSVGGRAVANIVVRWAALETNWISIPGSQKMEEYDKVLQMIKDAGYFDKAMVVSLQMRQVSKFEDFDPANFDPMDIPLGILIEGTYKPSKTAPAVLFVVSCDAGWAGRIDYQKIVQAKKIKVTLTVEQFVILYSRVKLSHIGSISGNLLDIDKRFQK